MNEKGHWVLNYVDDFIGADLWLKVWEAFLYITWLFENLRFKEAIDKRIEPTQEIEFLGREFNSRKMIMFVTATRMLELLDELSKLGGGQNHSIREGPGKSYWQIIVHVQLCKK